MHAKSLLPCSSLCDPVDCSPPGPSVREILQARTLERVAMSPSRGSSRASDRTRVSCFLCWQEGSLPHSTTWEAPECILEPLQIANRAVVELKLISHCLLTARQ